MAIVETWWNKSWIEFFDFFSSNEIEIKIYYIHKYIIYIYALHKHIHISYSSMMIIIILLHIIIIIWCRCDMKCCRVIGSYYKLLQYPSCPVGQTIRSSSSSSYSDPVQLLLSDLTSCTTSSRLHRSSLSLAAAAPSPSNIEL